MTLHCQATLITRVVLQSRVTNNSIHNSFNILGSKYHRCYKFCFPVCLCHHQSWSSWGLNFSPFWSESSAPRSAALLWSERRRWWFFWPNCECIVIFATKLRVRSGFQDISAHMLWFLRHKRFFREEKFLFSRQRYLFWISVSTFSVSQVFGAHTFTIYKSLPTKNSRQRPIPIFRKWDLADPSPLPSFWIFSQNSFKGWLSNITKIITNCIIPIRTQKRKPHQQD